MNFIRICCKTIKSEGSALKLHATVWNKPEHRAPQYLRLEPDFAKKRQNFIVYVGILMHDDSMIWALFGHFEHRPEDLIAEGIMLHAQRSRQWLSNGKAIEIFLYNHIKIFDWRNQGGMKSSVRQYFITAETIDRVTLLMGRVEDVSWCRWANNFLDRSKLMDPVNLI